MHATKNTLKPEKKAFILQTIYLEEIVTYVLGEIPEPSVIQLNA